MAYRPFNNAEEFDPHSQRFLQDVETGTRWLPTAYDDYKVRIGAEWIPYYHLVDVLIFADTKKPAGVKL